MRPHFVRELLYAAALVVFQPAIAECAVLDRAVAISDSVALRELDLREHPVAGADARGLGLAAMLGASVNASSADIFALPAMKPLRAALDREFDSYNAALNASPDSSGKLQPFDRDALYSKQTRFILAGIVNRMDRAYKSPATCGEIRLIYRPVANYGADAAQAGAPSARLPMTLNLVLDARRDTDLPAASCADIARRWLARSDRNLSGAALAAALTQKGGALEWVTPAHIDRIETNIQIAHAAANPNDFEARADYLMKVFKYDTSSKSFIEGPMENQIDRDRILADAPLANEFRQWLLTPENFAALDKGTVLIPDRFLAKRAVVIVPAVGSNTDGIFAEVEIVESLAKAARNNVELQNIKSPAGFERRLNDGTCAGCHQTRAIGGFHFPGVDWSGDAPSFVVAPASPHFFGDQPRRRDILAAFRDTRPLDFSRGFSARPQAYRADDLDGTTYLNGWGAQCYAPDARATRTDKSFSSWTCIDGLECQMPASGGTSTRAGLCFPE
jgi:hypothetical protein